MNTRSEEKPRFVRRVMAVLAALAVLAVCIGFVWLAWREYSQTRGTETVVVDQPGQVENRPQRRGDRLVASKSLIEGWAWPIQLHVELDRPPVPHLHHQEADRWTNREQEELLTAASRIVRGEGRLTPLAISAEQKAQLASLNLYRRMVLSDADQSQLNSLYAAWRSAAVGQPKAAAEQQFLAGAKAIGIRATDATKTSLAAGAERVKSILTPEQLEKYRQITRTPRPQAKTNGPTTPP